MRECFFINAFAGQRVVYIRQSNNLGGNRDFIPFEAVRITAPVVAFVVPAANLISRFNERLILVHRQPFQHIRADTGMALHDGEFLIGQLARLVEDGLVNRNLADIVQRGRRRDHGNITPGQRIAVGPLHQVGQQQLGKRVHMAHVLAALTVAEFNNMAEDINHQVALLLVFVNLVGHHADQLLLLGIQQDSIDHAPMDDQRVKGAADEIADPQLVSALDKGRTAFRRNHNDRDVLDPPVLVHHIEHPKTVHHRHDHIQQDQRDLHTIFLDIGDTFHAVFRLNNVILPAEDIGQDCAVHLRIIDN